VTVAPVQDWIGLSHEMRPAAGLCPDSGSIVSRSPVSWVGVTVEPGTAAPIQEC